MESEQVEAIPSDQALRKLGLKWYRESGAADLKRKSNRSYQDYVALVACEPIDEAIKAQIDKDVLRANGNAFRAPGMREFLSPMEKETTHRLLSEILYAYAKRNPFPGYAQGMDHICFLLIRVINESEVVFWLLCAVVEYLRLPDFYSPPPNGLAGFVLERRLLCYLVFRHFPNLVETLGLADVCEAVEVVSPKLLILVFIDFLPLAVNLTIFDLFFGHCGDLSVLLVCLGLIKYAEKEIIEAHDMMMTLQMTVESITVEELTVCMKDFSKYAIPTSQLLSRFQQGQKEFEHNHLLFILIDQLVLETPRQKIPFALFFEEAKNGINREVFINIIDAVCPHLPLNEAAIDGIFDMCKTNSIRHQKEKARREEERRNRISKERRYKKKKK